ncbi:uncharacterized protein [Manis javanica]|uniref:uncharacterized protein n=1 Tax=Manis javanica TaxID=9974 RepID=UPI003C6D8A7A
MDRMPPSLAVIFRAPPAPHRAVGRTTTAGLLCTSDVHRAGSRHPFSPGPTRCRGRHRRRPRPYPEVGRRPDRHATALGKATYTCLPGPGKAVGSTTAGLPRTSDAHRVGGRRPASPGPTRCRGRHRRRPQPYPEVGLGPDRHATALRKASYNCPLAPNLAVGSTTAGLPRTSDTDRMGGHRPASPGPTRCRGRHRRRPRPYPEVGLGPDGHATALRKDTYNCRPGPDKAVGSTTAAPKADDDDQEEVMDTTPPWLAVILRSPAAPHEAVGSTTASLPRNSDAHRAGGRRTASPGPTRCRGRHRRRPRPYPEVGLGPNRHATALGKATYNCPPGPDKAVGSITVGLPRTSDTDRAGGHHPVSPGPTRCRGRHRRQPRPYPEVGRKAKGHATALRKASYNCPPAPNLAMGSTTASLPRTSDTNRMGGRRPASPGPTRCHGRHRRRPRPYPEVRLGPDGLTTALRKGTY